MTKIGAIGCPETSVTNSHITLVKSQKSENSIYTTAEEGNYVANSKNLTLSLPWSQQLLFTAITMGMPDLIYNWSTFWYTQTSPTKFPVPMFSTTTYAPTTAFIRLTQPAIWCSVVLVAFVNKDPFHYIPNTTPHARTLMHKKHGIVSKQRITK